MKKYNFQIHFKHIAENAMAKIYYRIFAKCLPDKYYPYPFWGGRIYLNVRESPMMLQRVLRLYERKKINVVRKLLKPGMTFIDIGSNKGDFSLIASRIVGDDGTIMAFEPEPNNCKWIRKSIDLNGYNNITLLEMALGEENLKTKLYLGEKSGWHSLIPSLPSRNNGVIEVEKRTLDSILEERNCKHVDLLKIDVEGFEVMVLKGAYQTLLNNQGVVILLDMHPHLGVDPGEVCGFLKDIGFTLYEMNSQNRLKTVSKELQEVLAKR